MKSFRLLALTAAGLLSFAVAAVAAPVCSKKVNSFDSYLDDSPWKKGLRNDSTIQAGYFRTPEGNFMWGVPANGMVRLNNGRLMPARGNQLLQEP